MTTQKRTYLPEFKREALQLWQSSGKSASAIENESASRPAYYPDGNENKLKVGRMPFLEKDACCLNKKECVN